MGKIPLTPMEREDLSWRTAKMFTEIREKSGLSPSELEKIFRIGTGGLGIANASPITAGKYWKKLEKGERWLTTDGEQKIKIQAGEKGWLGEEWGFDYIFTDLRKDEGPTKYAAGKKIEKHLKKIVQILTEDMPGCEDDHLFYCRRLGDRLAKLYIQEWRRVCSGPGWKDEPLENSIAAAEAEAKSLLQFCSTENAKR